LNISLRQARVRACSIFLPRVIARGDLKIVLFSVIPSGGGGRPARDSKIHCFFPGRIHDVTKNLKNWVFSNFLPVFESLIYTEILINTQFYRLLSHY
jgi:hypothetical protein